MLSISYVVGTKLGNVNKKIVYNELTTFCVSQIGNIVSVHIYIYTFKYTYMVHLTEIIHLIN